VTEVKHLDEAFIFTDSVVNKNRAMLQFSYAGPFSDSATHAGKPAKQIHVVKQCAPKTHGSFAIVLGNMADDFSEIV
jgi:hypothetical protein